MYCQYIYLGIWAVNMIDAFLLSKPANDLPKNATTLKIGPFVDDITLKYSESMNTMQLICIKKF